MDNFKKNEINGYNIQKKLYENQELQQYIPEIYQYGYTKKDDVIVLYSIMEKTGNDLSYVYVSKLKLNHSFLRKIILDIFRGVRLIHNQKYVHRDLKLENIAFSLNVFNKLKTEKYEPSLIKILDFGGAFSTEGNNNNEEHLTAAYDPNYPISKEYIDIFAIIVTCAHLIFFFIGLKNKKYKKLSIFYKKCGDYRYWHQGCGKIDELLNGFKRQNILKKKFFFFESNEKSIFTEDKFFVLGNTPEEVLNKLIKMLEDNEDIFELVEPKRWYHHFPKLIKGKKGGTRKRIRHNINHNKKSHKKVKKRKITRKRQIQKKNKRLRKKTYKKKK